MIGDDLSRYVVDPKYTLFSDVKPTLNNARFHNGNTAMPTKAHTSGESTPKSGSGGSVQLDPSLPLSTSIRGVLGFRTVVLQRTQLRKMEKEIEKAIARLANDTGQPRSRTAARIGTGTRGMIPGATYTIMNAEPGSLDRAFLDDLSDILTRWKSLTVEVPCRTEIFRVFSKMFLSNRQEPLSSKLMIDYRVRGSDAKTVLSLFEQMRQQYPLQSDPEDLQDVLWCLSLLSSKYSCNKDRVMTLISEMLSPSNLPATTPLLPRNIHSLLASIVTLRCEQDSLPEDSRDPRMRRLLTDLTQRIRAGDLGVGIGREIKDRPLQEHNAQISFLRGLVECIRLRDQNILHYLLHEVIPNYWVEPDPLYPYALDGPIRALGQTASDFILNSPVALADCSEITKSLILDFTIFIDEFLPPAGLKETVSKDSLKAIVRFILTVLSVEYLEGQTKERPSADDIRYSRDEQDVSDQRGSISAEMEREYVSRTPPRSPLSPNVSGEHFQSRSLPSHAQNLTPDEATNPTVQRARAYLNGLWESGHQNLIIEQLQTELEDFSSRRLVNMYHRIVLGSPKPMGTSLLTATLNTFFSKLVSHRPESSERLSRLLLQLSVHHRALFFKPMIACVASDSAQFVADYLCVLSCLEMHIRLVDLYMKDADMICVIMMTDVGPERPRADSNNPGLKWGSCTVGQCVIILEFIYAIKRLARSGEHHDIEVGKMFLIDLERKLGMYLVAKEKKVLVPRPIRVLLCQMFYEIRMLCKTIHRPGWLPRILEWTMNHNFPTENSNSQSGYFGISDTMRLRIKHIYSSVDAQICERVERYTATIANASISKSARTPNISGNAAGRRDSVGGIQTVKTVNQLRRMGRLPDIRMDETVAVLMLLITVHSAVHVAEYLQLVNPLWQIYCMDSRPKVAASAAFLFGKCADLAPKTIHNLVTTDLTSEDPNKRLSAIEKLNVLFDHRNVLLSQPYVTDPSSRGPFRNAAIQVPFVTSEVGNNRYTMDEPRWLTELKSAGNFPADIRSRFESLGWGEKDQEEMEMTRRSQTPLMLSWVGFLDEDYDAKMNFGRTYTALPKDRHATVLIPVLNSLSMKTIDLLDDKTIGVRSAAITFMTNYIRNEPVLFVRSFFSEIVYSRPDRQRELIGRLHLLISSSSKLPPAFAFALFNHLLGLLKWFQRNSKPHGIDMMATAIPLLTDVVASTNDIVFKDFKRNKVDVFFTNLGRFWFRQGIMPESMFPYQLTETAPALIRQDIPYQLFQMAMTNIGQIQFMTGFLIRFPLEVQDLKGSIGRFNRLPRLNSPATAVGLKMEIQYLPDMTKQSTRFVETSSTRDKSMEALSSLRARAWLCFILNLLQRVEKNNSERIELMNIFNGVNVILLEHGDDLGIIGQALDIYITAATRLRRFFALQNGYSLIFPALFKIYCDSRAAKVVQDTIDAAFYRFYLLHQEAFILQSLGSVVPLMLRPMCGEQSQVMAQHLFSFLEALDDPKTTFNSKALGVQSLAEQYHEKRSYGGPQLEIPQWMTSFIPKDSKVFQSSNLLQRNDFAIAESIKLFLAIIAYDPGSLRSEQFIRALKMVLPYFLDREPILMTDGLDSLVEAMAKFCRSSKPLVPSTFIPPAVAPRPLSELDDTRGDISRYALLVNPLSKPQAIKGKTWAQNDRVAVKHEFICLIQHFCDKGGQLADEKHQQMAAILRSLIKDYTSIKVPLTTEWIKEYIQACIVPVHSLHQSSRAVLYLILQFSGVFKTTYKSVDYSGLMDGLFLIAEDSRRFLRVTGELSNVFRDKIVNPGLAFGVKEDWVSDSPYISQSKFCSSLVDLILAMINNADTDTTLELEEAAPTPRLIAYIVIPLCLRFKSRFRANCLDILEMQFWLRMLGLTIKAAEYDPTRRSSRTAGLFAPVLNAARGSKAVRSTDPATYFSSDVGITAPRVVASSVPQTPAPFKMTNMHVKEDRQEDRSQQYSGHTMNTSPGLLVDFIALRIIMVRGERYLSYHPGCWLDIFNIIKKYLISHPCIAASAMTGAGKYGRHNSYNDSGPPSPFPTTPNATTPRTSAPWTPLHRSASGTPFSPFRSSGDMTPYPTSVYTVDGDVPMTALGYVLWSFAETVFFNRLPLMIMLRPFLLDQLHQVDSMAHLSLQRAPNRSANSSGPPSPAFYWPSPAASPAGLYSPGMPPPHLRNASTESESAALKKLHRAERRNQWKSWSKPSEPMSAFTAIEMPVQGTIPMSPNASAANIRVRSTFSGSEHGRSLLSPHHPQDGALPTPQQHHHHHRPHIHKHRRGHDSRSEAVLPAILVHHANQAMDHVRTMMSSGSDGMTSVNDYGIPMYPEKRPIGTNLMPTTALVDRSPRFHPTEMATSSPSNGSDQQFLLPGKYERQPSSPGFGSMFLAREAAMRGPSQPPSHSPAQDSLSPPRQNRMSLTVPSSSSGGLSGHSSGSRFEAPAIMIGSPQLSLRDTENDPKVSPILGDPVELSTLAPVSPVNLPGAKKSRGILKPRIITTSPPMPDSEPQMRSSPGEAQPKGHCSDPGTLLHKMDSRNTDGSSIRSVGFSTGHKPSLSPQDQVDYQVACLQARTKIFLQNIEEETRTVLACFPATFSIGFATPVSNILQHSALAAAAAVSAAAISSAAISATAVAAASTVSPTVRPHQDARRMSTSSGQSGGEGVGHGDSKPTQHRRQTPSITIQDQSYLAPYLAPSPINPLPAAMEGNESLLGGHRYNRYSGSSGSSTGGSSLNALGETEEEGSDDNRPSLSIGSPVLLSVAPTKKPKERRSKSVIFNSQLQALEPYQQSQPHNLLHTQPPRSPALEMPSRPRPFSQSSTLAAPTLSLTTSSPPLGPMLSPPVLPTSPLPMTLGTPEGAGLSGMSGSPTTLNVPSISVRAAHTPAYLVDLSNPLSPDLRTRECEHGAATQIEALGPFTTPPLPPQVTVQDGDEVVPYIVEMAVAVSGEERSGDKTPPLGLGLQAPDSTPLPIFHITEDLN
ncbi:hypothetical protein CPC16_001601 [Podila verticillata]|nr:hypothetical protein CPC16_001601 [Podila verticillata]